MKILLLEDNKTLNETIKIKLGLKGYSVYAYTDGQEAYDNITEGFSCFLLDIHVPKVNGIKILKRIREYYKEIPVIIISSTIELDIIKEAYDFGCNDYLKKPFYIDELAIKVDKLCNISTQEVCFDDERYFDFEKCTIKADGIEQILTQKENKLMNLFMINKNELVSYENIQNYVWGGEYVSLDAIRSLIRRLKKKLIKNYIKSSSNRGYYFLIE